jgi:hypothetical protein
MPASRGFLDRFRASGTPGAAAGAGVPADRVAERDAELAAVFERLAPVEKQVEKIREDARARAEDRRAAAAAQSQRILAAARQGAEADRRDAAARVAALADAETHQALEEADRAASAIAEHAEHVVPRLADEVLADVASRLGVPAEMFSRSTA